MNQAKNKIAGIDSFKSLFVVGENDDSETAIFKQLFGMLGEVFIKYFSVNWIIHGRVTNKLVYLKYRGKMLRRIQNPESFTYIKKRFEN